MAVEVPRLLRGERIPHGARCLDVATGLGWATAGLVRLEPSAQIVAVDYDETILPRAREYLREHGAAGNSGLCRADGKHLPFRDGSFDLVLCLYGLHHFRGYSEALREIARVVKPAGTFALIDPVRRPGQPPGRHDGMEVQTHDELDRMLHDAGFEIVMSRVSLGRVRAVTHKRESATAAM